MILLIGFAFIAGVVTILSPCILPTLPIILSGSVGEGKKKPIGIVIGFIASFTFFTLSLSALVKVTGVSADALRSISVVTVFIFGLTLLVPKIQKFTEIAFSRLSRMSPNSAKRTGFFGGIVVGISIGLLWTPCVGPILASVITLAATSTINAAIAGITIAYALGTALPMFGIIYGGRALLEKVPWVTQKAASIQKAFGILMMLTAPALYFNIDRKFQAIVLETFPEYGAGLTSFEDTSAVRTELQKIQKEGSVEKQIEQSRENVFDAVYPQAPELIRGGQWFNSDARTLAQEKGKVVLVDFWTYTCINCIRTLPYLKNWHEKYKDKGLVIIGVHTPEFEFEKNPANLAQAIKDFKIEYPVMQDNEYATWQAYENRYWPAKYLIDKNGRVRYTHFGEGNYDETEKTIKMLLIEAGQSLSSEKIQNQTYEIDTQTPETYLGYGRMENFVSKEAIKKDQTQKYTLPEKLGKNEWGYEGTWTIGEEHAQPTQGATLKLNFAAKNVYLVMRSKNPTQAGSISITLDNKIVQQNQLGTDLQEGKVTVNADRLYSILSLQKKENHTITIEFNDNLVEIYAFTFG